MKNLFIEKKKLNALKSGDLFKFHRKEVTICMFVCNTLQTKNKCVLFFIENGKLESTPAITKTSFVYVIH